MSRVYDELVRVPNKLKETFFFGNNAQLVCPHVSNVSSTRNIYFLRSKILRFARANARKNVSQFVHSGKHGETLAGNNVS